MTHSLVKSLLLGAALLAGQAFAATPDGLITSKAKLALWTTANVRSTTVHVDTNDQVVTLYGKVPSAAQKALAEKTAREISGVRDVKNLLQVVVASDEKLVDKDDHELKATIEKALKADPLVKNSAVAVKSVDRGVVLLDGSARTLGAHLRAVTIADRQPGVRRVISEVRSPDAFGNDERLTFTDSARDRGTSAKTGSDATDMRITGAVKLRLLTAANIPSTEISVDTDDRVVTLFGMVPSAEVSQAASREARAIDGVVEVRNNLEVVPSSQRKVVEAKDSDLSRDLSLAFKGKEELKDVKFAVRNGTVRLTGTVPSAWDELHALRLTDQVTGVRGVENLLKVEERAQDNAPRN